MKIIVYGDSYVYGGGLDCEYAILNGIIDGYGDCWKIKQIESVYFEIQKEIANIRWTNLLSKNLNTEIINRGFSGYGWQYIHYRFFKDILNEKEETIYVFCPPRPMYTRLMIDNKSIEKININFDIARNEDFNCINLFDKLEKNVKQNTYTHVMNNLFTNKLFCQLSFQNISGIISYLLFNKKKFLFLPSWFNNLKESFLYFETNKTETNKIFSFFREDLEIERMYNTIIFKNIDNTIIRPFWNENSEHILPTGHPSIKAQEFIKDIYLERIKKICI